MDWWVLGVSIGTFFMSSINIIYSIYSTEKARKIELSYSERRKQFERLVQIVSDVSSMTRLYPYSTNGEALVDIESKILAKKPLFYANLDYKNKYADQLRGHFNLMVTLSLNGITTNGETSLKNIADQQPNAFKSILDHDKRTIQLYQILDLYTDEYRKSNDKLM